MLSLFKKRKIKRICDKIGGNPIHSTNKIATEENASHKTIDILYLDHATKES